MNPHFLNTASSSFCLVIDTIEVEILSSLIKHRVCSDVETNDEAQTTVPNSGHILETRIAAVQREKEREMDRLAPFQGIPF